MIWRILGAVLLEWAIVTLPLTLAGGLAGSLAVRLLVGQRADPNEVLLGALIVPAVTLVGCLLGWGIAVVRDERRARRRRLGLDLTELALVLALRAYHERGLVLDPAEVEQALRACPDPTHQRVGPHACPVAGLLHRRAAEQGVRLACDDDHGTHAGGRDG